MLAVTLFFRGGGTPLAKRSNPAAFQTCSILCTGVAVLLSACGSGQYTPQPVTLSVSLSNPVITLSPGASVGIPITIMAPTETVTFAINDLPFGVSEGYKESESNPSGLLTLTANASATPGTYKPTIIIGTSGQTASLTFTLQVIAAKASLCEKIVKPLMNQAAYYQ